MGGRRAWLCHWGWERADAEGGGDWGDGGCGSWPSAKAVVETEGGSREYQSISPIRWSSQMLEEKWSIPGLEGVRALRWERRNMLLLPTMQGAMATVLIAV